MPALSGVQIQQTIDLLVVVHVALHIFNFTDAPPDYMDSSYVYPPPNYNTSPPIIPSAPTLIEPGKHISNNY